MDHSGNDLQLISGFPRPCSGIYPERFRRVSVSVGSGEIRLIEMNRDPKNRDSVLLISWDSFLATLPSISLETCVIHSSLIIGTDVFPDWPFLVCSSCVSLETCANFHLLLKDSISFKEKMLDSSEGSILIYSLVKLGVQIKNDD